MKKAAVLIDSWKLPTFKKHLDAAGYTYTEGEGVTSNTLTLMVNFEWVAELQPIVQAANDECAKQKVKA